MMTRKVIFIALGILFSFSLKAQYKLDVNIKGATFDTLILGCYFNGGTYAIDTALNKNGSFSFSKKEKELDAGIYFLANTKGKYCELIIDKEQKFILNTNDEDWTKDMQVKGSKDNENYFNYINSANIFANKFQELERIKNDIGEEEYKKRINDVREVLDSIKNLFIESNPNHLLTKVLKATKPIDIPKQDPIYKEDGSIDSNAMRIATYSYYMNHYFDNIDLGCDGLLRTPESVFFKPYKRYWEDVLKYQSNDTIFELANKIIKKAEGTKNMYKYIVHDITERYLKSNIMGQEEIYVKMIKKYYETGLAKWMTPSGIETEVERANKWSNLLMGKTVPDLSCPDSTDNKWYSIYNLKADYKIIVFWSPGCGHCKEEIPKLFEVYKRIKDKYNIAVMSINSEDDIHAWKSFIKTKNLSAPNWFNLNGMTATYNWKEYFDVISTPVLFLLDKNNRIIGKKLGSPDIENYINLIHTGQLTF